MPGFVPLPMDLLRDYFVYAQQVAPVSTDAATAVLCEFYQQVQETVAGNNTGEELQELLGHPFFETLVKLSQAKPNPTHQGGSGGTSRVGVGAP